MTSEKYSTCIDACNACADACDHCSVACLGEPGVANLGRCIRLDMDCAALCRLAAGFMSRDSEHASSICRACAELCDACAQECEKHDHDHCRQCAQACRDCAAACRDMAA
ncbi:four-helix bundle copper-binding protein [Kineobactrum salinum]|uniref:Four-helix bundle copper-binding protein n=1 Tax=Kineobactrum salinum TaxID=2708301 RepID=A0A6C0TXQ6_9GAMM|nr:four-helix bundle copper-binding protein [Kineobactrum salinum]QIB64418.1 four-helix bundle copper-binding protein [Kineobactrum salinum]